MPSGKWSTVKNIPMSRWVISVYPLDLLQLFSMLSCICRLDHLSLFSSMDIFLPLMARKQKASVKLVNFVKWAVNSIWIRRLEKDLE